VRSGFGITTCTKQKIKARKLFRASLPQTKSADRKASAFFLLFDFDRFEPLTGGRGFNQ
jgi:hypothetical protein